MIFFTSDLHLFHDKVIAFANRPFGSLEHMHAGIIHDWNLMVRPEDHVWVLGDVTFGKHEETAGILEQLNGTLHLVRGNHDSRWTDAKVLSMGFSSVHDYKEMTIDGVGFCLFHFPIESWNRKAFGAIHAHGHLHGNVLQKDAALRRFDVGVDANGYAPRSAQDLINLAAATPLPGFDHHGAVRR